MRNLKLMLMFIAAPPGWLAYLLAMTPLVLLGFPLIAVALLSKRYVHVIASDAAHKPTVMWSWNWMETLYGNREDGIDGSANGFWPKQPAFSWRERWQIFRWSAWRNSVGNARWLPFFGMTVDPEKAVVWFYEPDFTVHCIDAMPARFADMLKTGPYIAHCGLRFEWKFSWNSPEDWRERRIAWIGWRIAQQTALTPAVGYAFQPWSRL